MLNPDGIAAGSAGISAQSSSDSRPRRRCGACMARLPSFQPSVSNGQDQFFHMLPSQCIGGGGLLCTYAGETDHCSHCARPITGGACLELAKPSASHGTRRVLLHITPCARHLFGAVLLPAEKRTQERGESQIMALHGFDAMTDAEKTVLVVELGGWKSAVGYGIEPPHCTDTTGASHKSDGALLQSPGTSPQRCTPPPENLAPSVHSELQKTSKCKRPSPAASPLGDPSAPTSHRHQAKRFQPAAAAAAASEACDTGRSSGNSCNGDLVVKLMCKLQLTGHFG
jgi:hypothetical protein